MSYKLGYIVVPRSYIGKKVRVYRNNDEVTMFIEDPFIGGQIVRDVTEFKDIIS